MRPHLIQVTAFGAFGGHAEVRFDELADSGLFLLHGETGAGKTTLLDAIGFALYGRVPGERNKARRLRSDHAAASERTEVTFETTIGGRHLRITRSPQQIRPKLNGTGMTTEQARVLLEEETGGSWRTLSTRANEADREIGDAMGMSAEQFFQVVLLPQGQFAQFLHADADERRKLLQKLFRTDQFRAVEDWLADRRNTTRHKVEEAERDLATLTARISQVAGVPVPGEEPGDGAGLANASAATRAASVAGADAGPSVAGGSGDVPVVAGAAVAGAAGSRAGSQPELTPSWAGDLVAAAEADRDAAAQAVQAARSDLASSRAAETAARELADRQGRRAALLRRRTELQGREPDVAALRQELGDAERAAEIARVFTDADRTARALADAATAEADARAAAGAAGLDPGASVAELRAAEQEHRQRVGQLTGLREVARQADAEDTLAAAARQRAADREREIAHGEQALAGQQARLAELTAGRETAQQAVVRLPVVRGAADRQRAAAADADQLAETSTGRRELYEERLAARERLNDLRDRFDQLRRDRIDGMIAELAAKLVHGEPCPVCGSLDHPDTSELRGRRVSHQEEEQAGAEVDAATAAVTKLETELAALGAHAADLATRLIAADVTDPVLRDPGVLPTAADHAAVVSLDTVERLHELAAVLAADADRLETEAAGLDSAAGQLSQYEDDLTGLRAAVAEQGQQQSARAEQRQAALAEAAAAQDRAAGHRAALASQLAGAPDLETAIAVTAALADALATAASAADAAAVAAAAAERAEGDAGRAAAEAGFSSVGAARSALREPGWRTAQQETVRKHEAEAASVAEQLADPELDVPLEPAVDLDGAQAAVQEAAERHDEAVSRHGRAGDKAAALAGLAPPFAAAMTALLPLRERAAEARDLANLAAGQGANTFKMTLSSFVLAARLEEVAEAASQRLLKMTAGRYSLAHTDTRRGAGRAGLGLLALDAWTGQERDTSTLSGGETFLASLALALGLADVVTAEAAGVAIEALFVDEGFGSLDEDTLEEVMNVLDSLREGGRMVGIVSHVSELRQRIPAQVHVRKGRAGSTVELVTS